MTADLTRRRLLQAAGATVAAGYVTSGAGTATATPAPVPPLVTYPIPAGIAQASTFEVKVRTAAGAWTTVPTYSVNLKQINATTGAGQVLKSSMAYFDFADSVEVWVRYTKGTIDTARIRPLSLGIEPTIDDESTLLFTLTEPRKIVVEVNGEIFDCLHLLARPIETDAPSPDDPDVIYYGPGVHTTATGQLEVPSGKTVYLAGGAVLKTSVIFKNVTNAGLTGRGLVYSTNGGGCTIVGSKNIRVDGISMLDLTTGYAITAGMSEQVTITDFGYFSAGQWGDGIDIFSSSDVLIDNSFLRCSDDCIALYTHRWDYYGDTRNITVSNSSLWADVAHPINIGTHGNTADPEVLENITISNVDILDHREPQKWYQGAIALNPGDSNLVRNVRIENVRVEDFRWGQFLHLRVAYNKSYNTSAGRGIEGVYVKNLTYTGKNAETAMMLGYDEARGIKDVTFQNLVVNGTVMASTMRKPGWFTVADMVNMHVNEHVTNLRWLDAATAPTTTPPTITTADIGNLTAGVAVVLTISATGFPTGFDAQNLPAGLTVDKTTGVITGAPTSTGTYNTNLSVTNVAGTTTKSLILTVR
ncbi:putative Ig domain-containing protein [Kribbella sp. VKM Ac-2569]|uniref:glycosyl hydrolase family 28 protein n=1 Tax=Kribbella sp. VKM Ac-2569 TaxID=2512220 RepID=UPI00102C5CD0|nr:glycosyl hydrolase family 28 protein [Kribbella sp. VKM Ac-2569]RZT11738.1 putative Ig domain-containing protein [Kribbella sp. VKM Ac-2569]